jgi:hypothetical protein
VGVALLAGVGVRTGFGGEVALRDPGLEHLGAQPFDPAGADGWTAGAMTRVSRVQHGCRWGVIQPAAQPEGSRDARVR